MLRSALFISLITALTLPSLAQKVSYDIPTSINQPITKADYKHIVDTALAVVTTRYKVESVAAGSIHALNDQGQSGTFNLDNLVLKCLAEPDHNAWDGIIHAHFDNLFNSMDQQRKLDPTNYETMKKYLSLRIYPQSMVDQRGGTDSLVVRTDLEGTYTLLMIDFPGAFTPVRKNMFGLWKKDAASVFRVAQDNVDSEKVSKVTKNFEVEGIQLEVSMLGEENYAASYALDLQNNSPELLGQWGCAVAIPNKGLVTTCKISRDKPIDFVKFIQFTQPFVEKSYQQHPQPVSDQYFWYYQGKFTHIETKIDENGHLNVLAPAGLAELMTVKP